ncbi:MAG: hypothetical protein Q9M89_09905 [Persephonella sp.]|nr:hypothetical protein [Persephonella sp.]
MLKIDREFIKDLLQDKEDVEIVRTIIKLSANTPDRSMLQKVLENRKQLDILRI